MMFLAQDFQLSAETGTMLGSLKTLVVLMKDAFLLLRRTEPLILSSSTAFFATFSLSPILLLLANLFGLYLRSENVNNVLFRKVGSVIGFEAAHEIESIVNNFMAMETTWWLTVGGLIFFVFVSTTLLTVIKKNIHKMWRIRRSSIRLRQSFKERFIQISIILITGGLFLISFMIDSSLAISLDYLQSVLPYVGIILIRLLNIFFSVIVVTLWFTILFKTLPQARVNWDVAFNGAFMTAILFTGGKFLLGKILVHARFETIFGASASFALLLLFIFYSSFILYYGAAFTYVYADESKKHICPGKYASEYEERLVESRYDAGHPEVSRGA